MIRGEFFSLVFGICRNECSVDRYRRKLVLLAQASAHSGTVGWCRIRADCGRTIDPVSARCAESHLNAIRTVRGELSSIAQPLADFVEASFADVD